MRIGPYFGTLCGFAVGVLAIVIWMLTFEPHGGVELSRYLFALSAFILKRIYPAASIPVPLWYGGALLQWVILGRAFGSTAESFSERGSGELKGDESMKASDTSSDAKGLWALFWRMLVFFPVIGVFGTLALAAVVLLTIAPPFLAILFVIKAGYFWACATLALWFVWLRYGGSIRRFVLEGFEHGSLQWRMRRHRELDCPSPLTDY
jgi:hypothetical protein